ncbi:IS110 family transposase, partial [Xenorhabdus sp. Flor]|nr:IS110 family transposase [Xenorhabdus sp. Flor]
NYGEWIKQLMQRRPVNIVAIALANKIARIAWVILTGEEKFRVTS